MEFSLPLSTSMVQRLACDCSVTRVLLDQPSLVIDVGRATHRIQVALRKALEPTDLDNLVLLCRRHHRMHHEAGWLLAVSEGELVTIAPTITFALARRPD